MTARLGLVGLCTSHPQKWVPIIRELAQADAADVEITAAWDSGETRPDGHARVFCERFQIPQAVDSLDQMIELVDCVMIHTANWDRHIEQARPFVEAGKAVFLDKPIVGCLRDVNQLLDWEKAGKRIMGGSSLRFAREIREFMTEPVAERGEVHTAFAGCGVDEFNYGVHAYAQLSALMGVGLRSVRYLGESQQKHLQLTWPEGRKGFLAIGKVDEALPFHITAVTNKRAKQMEIDSKKIYRSLLEAMLPFLCGKVEKPPFNLGELLEPELAALAALASWRGGGQEIYLTDLRLDDPGYDGFRFAAEYRRALVGRPF